MKRKTVLSLAAVLFALIFAGCNIQIMYSGTDINGNVSGSYKLFSGTKNKTIHVKEGNPVEVKYSSKLKKGELTMTIYDSNNNIVYELETNKSGTKLLKADKDEEYKLEIVGDGAEGSFSVKWNN